ncbi:MAG: GTP-binding protein [Pseudomonadales bacterium]|jgi:G3E family GTPase|nr:GTP-binding protein [Pseudomonadales bacterium]
MTTPGSRQQRERIPVAVLTGFLGSGKTTLLSHLARAGELGRTLVLVNEFGEVGLDHQLLVPIEDDTLVAMDSGCICCTIRRDLAETLARAPGRYARGGERWFDRVVIETTGIADPAPILQTLLSEPSVVQCYTLTRVLATVDAVNGESTLLRHAEAHKQIAVADRLLLTKTDLATEEQVASLRERLEELAPSVPVSPVTDGAIDPAWLFARAPWSPEGHGEDVVGWLAAEHAEAHGHSHDRNRHGRVQASALVFDEPVDPRALDACLEGLLLFRGSDLLRVKGIVNVAGMDRPMVIHGVQHVFHPPEVLDRWPDADRRTRIVMITQDLDQTLLAECFARFGLTPSVTEA